MSSEAVRRAEARALATSYVEAAAWEQHERDGHGYHPDDPHYCWPEHRAEYMEDARWVILAAKTGIPEQSPRAFAAFQAMVNA